MSSALVRLIDFLIVGKIVFVKRLKNSLPSGNFVEKNPVAVVCTQKSLAKSFANSHLLIFSTLSLLLSLSLSRLRLVCYSENSFNGRRFNGNFGQNLRVKTIHSRSVVCHEKSARRGRGVRCAAFGAKLLLSNLQGN